MRRLALALTVPSVLLASCVGGSHSATARTPQPDASTAQAPSAPRSAHAGHWSTYHRTNLRSGTATHGVKAPLKHAWTANLDGSVYGEALVINGTVIVATENDSVYGLKPASGKVKWRTHLATPESQSDIQNDQPSCGNIFPLGITGTPAYDAKTGSVFVVAESLGGHHTLWAVNAGNGHRRWHRSTDVIKGRDRRAEQQRSALLVSHGRVFTAYGGLSGDCGNYVGYITSTATDGKGKTTHYNVPTPREAGMWSPAGPVEGANGNIYVASGNGAEVNGKYDKSDSVTELTPKALHRVGLFAPSVWRSDNQNDRDLGSSSPVPVPAVKRMLISGKNGNVYLLRPNHLGGVGGNISSLGGCSAFGGAAVRGHIVVMPCISGVRALTVGKHSLHWRWNASGIYGSPVIAGGRVYVADHNSGTLHVLGLRRGHPLTAVSVGSFTHFPSASIVGNQILVPTLSGLTAIRGS